jgi:hypothetical protein
MPPITLTADSDVRGVALPNIAGSDRRRRDQKLNVLNGRDVVALDRLAAKSS